MLANYPNPFNPETWIPFQLAKSADVKISIYAADGKLIRMLELGHQPIGTYQGKSRAAYWDGKNNPVNLWQVESISTHSPQVILLLRGRC